MQGTEDSTLHTIIGICEALAGVIMIILLKDTAPARLAEIILFCLAAYSFYQAYHSE